MSSMIVGAGWGATSPGLPTLLDVLMAVVAAAGLTAATISTYCALVRAGESRFPWLGYLLGTKYPPTYDRPELDSTLDD